VYKKNEKAIQEIRMWAGGKNSDKMGRKGGNKNGKGSVKKKKTARRVRSEPVGTKVCPQVFGIPGGGQSSGRERRGKSFQQIVVQYSMVKV